MALSYSARRVLQGVQRALVQRRAFTVLASDELDAIYSSARPPTVCFLGPPGVGKGTYSQRVADYFGLTSITTGDLIRNEMLAGTQLGHEFDRLMTEGEEQLMPDAPILRMLRAHFMKTHSEGTARFVLDGFPRTVVQAQALDLFADVQLVVNLGLRQEVLLTKIMGHRKCTFCKKTFNVHEIRLPATDDGLPEVNVPAIPPPEQCLGHLEDHSNQTEAQVLENLAQHEEQVAPVLRYYKERMKLVDFEITGGVDQTLPRLLQLLKPHLEVAPLEPLRAQAGA